MYEHVCRPPRLRAEHRADYADGCESPNLRSREPKLVGKDSTTVLARGVDLRTISDILGHSQYSTTADLYAHVAPQLKRDAADTLEEAFGK